MPKSLHKKVAQRAEREGVSMNQYLVSLISSRQSEAETAQKIFDQMEKISQNKRYPDVKLVTQPIITEEYPKTRPKAKNLTLPSSGGTFKFGE